MNVDEFNDFRKSIYKNLPENNPLLIPGGKRLLLIENNNLDFLNKVQKNKTNDTRVYGDIQLKNKLWEEKQPSNDWKYIDNPKQIVNPNELPSNLSRFIGKGVSLTGRAIFFDSAIKWVYSNGSDVGFIKNDVYGEKIDYDYKRKYKNKPYLDCRVVRDHNNQFKHIYKIKISNSIKYEMITLKSILKHNRFNHFGLKFQNIDQKNLMMTVLWIINNLVKNRNELIRIDLINSNFNENILSKMTSFIKKQTNTNTVLTVMNQNKVISSDNNIYSLNEYISRS